MASVQAHKGKAEPRRLHRMSIEKAANGVSVHKHYTGGRDQHGMMMGHQEESPAVFNKLAHAKKHVMAGLAEMHGEPDEDDTPGALTGGPAAMNP